MKPRYAFGWISAAALAASISIVGCGVKSPPVPPQQAVPERIVDLDAISQRNGVMLSWERPEHTAGGRDLHDLGSFEIERAEGSGPFTELAEISVTDQARFQVQRKFTYLDGSAQLDHHYRYQVISSTLDSYRSDPSNQAELTHQLPKPPPNPENFVIPLPKAPP